MRLVWSPSALADIAHIHAYVADFNPKAAQALAAALLALGDSLTNFPDRGRPVGDNLREVMPLYPYILRYELRAGVIEILRVRHGMRQQ